MAKRTTAQRAAEARYDAKRTPPIGVRLSDAERAELDADRQPGESRAGALRRGWLAYIRSRSRP